MRAILGCLACLAAFAWGTASAQGTPAATAPAAPGATAAPVTAGAAPAQAKHRLVYLKGYYDLNLYPTWRASDSQPWEIVPDAPWADSALIKWGGYTAVTHDGKHYYCLINDRPVTGTRVGDPAYVCGEPSIAQMMYQNNWKPLLMLYADH